MTICTVEDEYAVAYKDGNTRWVVKLNDGTMVYQDDDRPGLEVPSAWRRLRTHCYENGVYPVDMYLQFRSHIEHITPNAEGYYFVRSILGQFGSNKCQHFYVVGIIEGHMLLVHKWKTPELIVVDHEYRWFKEHDECLISKNLCLQQVEKFVPQLS